MLVKREFHNIECDCCGQILDEETWWDDKDALSGILDDCGWKALGGKHYCDSCWTRDDDDNIATKDGRKFDDDTGCEIKVYKLDYLKYLLDESLTLTQIYIGIRKSCVLYHSMVGTLYKNALANEINVALDMLEDRKKTAPQWQKDCYDTFLFNGIFDKIEDLMYQNNYNCK